MEETNMRVLSLFALCALFAAYAQAGKKEVVMNPDGMKWVEVTKGATQAVLWGDPAKGAHGVITKFEPGTVHPLHHHTSDLKLMMVTGSYWMETEDGKKVSVKPGGYLFMPANLKHKSGCEEACSFFMTANGKFDLVMEDGAGEATKKAKK
jgi:quercetin dioxygenase-like cupin family protein